MNEKEIEDRKLALRLKKMTEVREGMHVQKAKNLAHVDDPAYMAPVSTAFLPAEEVEPIDLCGWEGNDATEIGDKKPNYIFNKGAFKRTK